MNANGYRMLGIAAGALVTIGVSSVNAADITVPPTVPMAVAPVATWTGPYAGVALGYGFHGRVKVDGEKAPYKADGFAGNAFLGWNGQSDAFIYGVEADVGYNNMRIKEEGDEFKYGADGSLRARLGYAVTDDILIYGTGGGAISRIKAETPDDSDSATALGWTVGAGADVRLTEQSFARLEYRYTDFGSKTLRIDGDDLDFSANSHKVMVGIGMQF